MSEQVDKEGNPLLQIDTYTGKLYWLNLPRDADLNLESLKEEFESRTFHEDISNDFKDDENVVIPDIFEKDGRMVRTTTTNDVHLISQGNNDIIVGGITLDMVDFVMYRENKIIVLDTIDAKFILLKQGGTYYLAVLAPRKLSETIVDIFRNEFSEFGSLINETRLEHESISEMRNDLDADLMDTIITDYDQKEITQTRIQGENYQDTKVYRQQKSEGKVKTHMFQTDQLVPEDTKTIMVGRDGLVRIYSNATVETYIKLLKEHVIPLSHRDVESSPSVGSYEAISNSHSNPIFTIVDDSDD